MSVRLVEEEHYIQIKVLGQGAMGKAILVENPSDHSKWVMKQVNLAKMNPAEQKEAVHEAQILESLKHPNIVSFKEVFKTKKGKLCIVMEYADGGDLYKLIKSRAGRLIPENEVLDLFTQICLALKHVHDKKILHRDLKTQNLFITKSNLVKMGDFGIAKPLKNSRENAKTMVGTPYYISPEIINNQPYSFKSDIWSLGVILYELCALKPPFQGDNLSFLALKIVKGKFNAVPSIYSLEIKQLIQSLLNLSPNKRPTVEQVLRIPLVTSRIKNYLTTSIQPKTPDGHNAIKKPEKGIGVVEEFFKTYEALKAQMIANEKQRPKIGENLMLNDPVKAKKPQSKPKSEENFYRNFGGLGNEKEVLNVVQINDQVQRNIRQIWPGVFNNQQQAPPPEKKFKEIPRQIQEPRQIQQAINPFPIGRAPTQQQQQVGANAFVPNEIRPQPAVKKTSNSPSNVPLAAFHKALGPGLGANNKIVPKPISGIQRSKSGQEAVSVVSLDQVPFRKKTSQENGAVLKKKEEKSKESSREKAKEEKGENKKKEIESIREKIRMDKIKKEKKTSVGFEFVGVQTIPRDPLQFEDALEAADDLELESPFGKEGDLLRKEEEAQAPRRMESNLSKDQNARKNLSGERKLEKNHSENSKVTEEPLERNPQFKKATSAQSRKGEKERKESPADIGVGNSRKMTMKELKEQYKKQKPKSEKDWCSIEVFAPLNKATFGRKPLNEGPNQHESADLNEFDGGLKEENDVKGENGERSLMDEEDELEKYVFNLTANDCGLEKKYFIGSSKPEFSDEKRKRKQMQSESESDDEADCNKGFENNRVNPKNEKRGQGTLVDEENKGKYQLNTQNSICLSEFDESFPETVKDSENYDIMIREMSELINELNIQACSAEKPRSSDKDSMGMGSPEEQSDLEARLKSEEANFVEGKTQEQLKSFNNSYEIPCVEANQETLKVIEEEKDDLEYSQSVSGVSPSLTGLSQDFNGLSQCVSTLSQSINDPSKCNFDVENTFKGNSMQNMEEMNKGKAEEDESLEGFYCSDYMVMEEMQMKLEKGMGEAHFIKAYRGLTGLFDRFAEEEVESKLESASFRSEIFREIPSEKMTQWYNDLLKFVIMERIIDENPHKGEMA